MIDIKIKEELKRIETQEDITILFACESGSRGWGFSSLDSDYDVRFIYIKPINWYLSIDKKKETIEFPISDNLDVNGWDIRKALTLVYNSNAALFEWLQSPIIYKSFQNFRINLFKLSSEFFSPKKMMRHYLGLTKKSLSSRERDKIRIKKYFYILRPLLAAMWIAKYNRIPPMEFHMLLKQIENRKGLLGKIEKLLEIKKASLEGDHISLIPEVEDFIEKEFERCENIADNMSDCKKSADKLNLFFREVLKRCDKKL
jgi:predicted nucleotidyltransferase